jgi:hypothetical protein
MMKTCKTSKKQKHPTKGDGKMQVLVNPPKEKKKEQILQRGQTTRGTWTWFSKRLKRKGLSSHWYPHTFGTSHD